MVQRDDMSIIITTAPAVVMEVEIHCAQARENKISHMKLSVCWSSSKVSKAVRILFLFVLTWIMLRQMLAREDEVLMGYLHLNLH